MHTNSLEESRFTKTPPLRKQPRTKSGRRKPLTTAALGFLLAASLLAGCGAPASSTAPATSSRTESPAVTSSAASAISSGVSSPASAVSSAAAELTPTPAPVKTEPDPSWSVYRTETGIKYIGGTFTKDKVDNRTAALKAVTDALPLLGAPDGIVLEALGDPLKVFDTSIYQFVEKRGSEVVEGSTVKLIVSGDGTVLSLNSALGGKTLEVTEPISKEQAQEIVARTFPKVSFETNVSEPLPILITEDGREGNDNTVRAAYRVYTNNPGTQALYGEKITEANAAEAGRYPYLIHYVGTNGQYLFHLPSQDVVNGELKDQEFNHDTIFEMEGIEPVKVPYTPSESWKGKEVSGGEMTLDLVRNSDGNYLFIDTNRRIVMCDYESYNSPEEGKPKFQVRGFERLEDADQEMLVLWGNFARIHDFFRDVVGWKAPDGKGTDTMLLYYPTDPDGNPKNDSYYRGSRAYGFETFAISKGFGDCYTLDILAHEFTHCVTKRSLLGNGYYFNEQGAINEALSDIIGYMADMLITKEEGGWLVGRNELEPIRSFSDPEQYQQPATFMGRYYVPNVYLPTADNDRGGVHANSSLVNHIAYLLCAKGGMTYEEALRYWLNVDMSLTGDTDFQQLAVILPYTLKALGMEKYAEVLTEAMKKVSLADSPKEVVPGTALVDFSMDEASFMTYYHDAEIPPVAVYLLRYHEEKDAFEVISLNVANDGHFRLPLSAEKGETIKTAVLLQDLATAQAILYDKDEDVWRDVTDILSSVILSEGSEGLSEGETRADKLGAYLIPVAEGSYITMNLTNGFYAVSELAGQAAEAGLPQE